jgi:hypothetical protein
VIVVSLIGVPAFALIDAAARPPSAWTAADRSKGLWIALLTVTGLLGVGVITGVIYLTNVRPKLLAKT